MMTEATPLSFRPGTMDEAIFHWVHTYNGYQLPNRFAGDDIILDIGAHIGSFSYAALERGAQHVFAFEAERSNYDCAARNLKPFGARVQVRNEAVWRSDQSVQVLSFTRSHEVENTGGGNVLWAQPGITVKAVAFDDVIREITEGGRKRVRMLKLDCETSEFPILLTSKSLHLIDSIVGEYHECQGKFDSNPIPDHARVAGVERFTIKELLHVLNSAGFDVRYARERNSRGRRTNIGPFFAHRPSRWNPLPLLRRLKQRLAA
jgi:FkbM family methyltransferase